ncbi:hypothetical protein BRN32_08370 [Xanthomonas oryzae pv. oryzae]|nr:hypothetical protein BRN32_08370 [Xanthomonas oryzae pv. oryzae]
MSRKAALCGQVLGCSADYHLGWLLCWIAFLRTPMQAMIWPSLLPQRGHPSLAGLESDFLGATC